MARKQLIARIALYVTTAVCMLSNHTYALSSLSKNDPYPMFTAMDPQEFLYTQEKQKLKGLISEQYFFKERASLSISPFGQNANRGRNFCGDKYVGGKIVELGDIMGRWGMIPLLFGELPEGKVLPPTLQAARDALFPGVVGPIDDVQAIDAEQLFGYFSIPLKYRKYGLRFEMNARLTDDWGLNVQLGISDISQCLVLTDSAGGVQGFKDLSAASKNLSDGSTPAEQFFNCTDISLKEVQVYLMHQMKNITEELGINICDFDEISVEELRFQLFWRHAFQVNFGADNWPQFLAIPYLEFGGSVSPGKTMDPSFAFSLPFGNNGFYATGFTTGINFDFVETIEVGAEVGFTHFFERDIKNMRIPNYECQSGIFPFTTNAKVSPGNNWQFAAKLAAYHFMDKLSFWSQYVMVDHQADSITLQCPDPAFKPEALAKKTKFSSKLANVAFTYDFSPHISVGFLWQAPLAQRGTYRSTTVLFTVFGVF
ncbi:MAG TPA: hypothetical protein PLU71_02555 [Candidatus Dependentiae bacterium]|nr:hypothetical protein [Candidatus Dependentiae bacterium]HRQ62711.1 hypothetical protein [Candidatus Dependentiae bacterium]